jgi:hypothetical protein
MFLDKLATLPFVKPIIAISHASEDNPMRNFTVIYNPSTAIYLTNLLGNVFDKLFTLQIQ